MLLKLSMMEAIEKYLRSKVSDEEQKNKIKVADINFVLKNGWLF